MIFTDKINENKQIEIIGTIIRDIIDEREEYLLINANINQDKIKIIPRM